MADKIPFADIPDEPLLNIKAVSQATEIEAVTLRAWERRYGVPSPKRTDHGYRLYSERDVMILRWLKSQVDSGVTIKHAVAILYSHSPQVERHGAYDHTPALVHGITTGHHIKAAFEEFVPALVEYARRYDTSGAQRLLRQSFVQFSIEDACLHVLLPAYEHTLEQESSGQLSISQERFIVGIMREQVLSSASSVPSAWQDRRILTGLVAGESGDLPILILNLLLRRRGWDVVYIGQISNPTDLQRAIDMITPRIMVVTAASLEEALPLYEVGQFVERGQYSRARFLYGGPLFAYAPELEGMIPGIGIGSVETSSLDQIEQAISLEKTQSSVTPYQPPNEVVWICHTLDEQRLIISHRLGLALHDADPSLKLFAAQDLAHAAIGELRAALFFGHPEVLSAQAVRRGGHSIARLGISTDTLINLMPPQLGSDYAHMLLPYLVNL